jgi:hypothetical protein
MDNNVKTLAELQEFCDAQQKVIIQLNKKIQKLEAEKNTLENTVKNSSPNLFGKELHMANDMATEEAICALQIKRLEETSLERELTLEETRKLEAFSKILATFRSSTKGNDSKTKGVSPAELLKLVENDDSRK